MSNQISIYQIVAGADILSQIVMLVLLILSIVSLSIIIEKYIQYKNISKKNYIFEEALISSNSIYDLGNRGKKYLNNPVFEMVHAAIYDMDRRETRVDNRHEGRHEKMTDYVKHSTKERVEQSMVVIKNKYFERLNSKLSLVGTIGSNSPFIGLLGMVLSVMQAFQKMSTVKHATISMMSENLTEAFFVTVLGLFVAILSMVMYEALVTKSEKLSGEIDNYMIEISKMAAQEIEDR